jgi:hypothetical protein
MVGITIGLDSGTPVRTNVSRSLICRADQTVLRRYGRELIPPTSQHVHYNEMWI